MAAKFVLAFLVTVLALQGSTSDTLLKRSWPSLADIGQKIGNALHGFNSTEAKNAFHDGLVKFQDKLHQEQEKISNDTHNLRAKFEEVAEKVKEKIKEDIQKLENQTATIRDKIIAGIKNLKDKLQPPANSTTASKRGLLDDLFGVLKNVVGGVKNQTQSVLQKLEQDVKNVGEKIKSDFEKLGGKNQPPANTDNSTTASKRNLFDNIFGALKNAAAVVKNQTQSVLQKLEQDVKNVGEKIKSDFEKLGGKNQPPANTDNSTTASKRSFIDDIVGALKNAAAGVKNQTQSVLQKIEQDVKNVGEKIKSDIEKLEGKNQPPANTDNSTTASKRNLFDDISGALKNAAAVVKNQTQSVLQKLEQDVKNVKEKIKSDIEKLQGKNQPPANTDNSTTASKRNLFDDIVGALKNAAAGVKNQTQSVLQKLEQDVKNVGEKIKSDIEKLQGKNQPPANTDNSTTASKRNLFDDIVGALKNAAAGVKNQTQSVLQKLEQDVKNVGEKIKSDIEKLQGKNQPPANTDNSTTASKRNLFDDIVGALKNAAAGVKNQTQSVLQKLEQDVKNVGEKIKSDIEKLQGKNQPPANTDNSTTASKRNLFDDIVGALKNAAAGVKNQTQSVLQKLEQDVKNVGEKIKSDFEKLGGKNQPPANTDNSTTASKRNLFDDIVGALKNAAAGVKNQTQSVLQKLEQDVKNVGEKIKSDFEKLGGKNQPPANTDNSTTASKRSFIDDIVGALKNAAAGVKNQTQSVLQKIEQDVKNVGEKIKSDIEKLQGKNQPPANTDNSTTASKRSFIDDIVGALKNAAAGVKNQTQSVLQKLEQDVKNVKEKIKSDIEKLEGKNQPPANTDNSTTASKRSLFDNIFGALKNAAAVVKNQTQSVLQKLEQDVKNVKEKIKSDIEKLEGKNQPPANTDNSTTASKRGLFSLPGSDLLTGAVNQIKAIGTGLQDQISGVVKSGQQAVANATGAFTSGLNVINNLGSLVNASILPKLPDLSKIGTDVSDCFQTQVAQLKTISDSAKTQIEDQKTKLDQQITIISGQVNTTRDSVKALTDDISSGVSGCTKSLLTALPCLATLTATETTKATALASQVGDIIKSVETAKLGLLTGGGSIFASIAKQALEQGMSVGSNTIKCVQTKIAGTTSPSA